MLTDINYRGYNITFGCGYYWIYGSKTPYQRLADAKETIDFWIDAELVYIND